LRRAGWAAAVLLAASPPAAAQTAGAYDHAAATAPSPGPGGAALPPPDQGATHQDRLLAERIRLSLSADRALSASAAGVRIRADQGRVTLDGYVGSQGEKDAVGNQAAKFAGAARVDNRLQVADPLLREKPAADAALPRAVSP
jgi:osmotically-inducible protein OsmY